MRTVAALYIDPEGPYPSLPDVDTWAEQRNAKLYAGPHPVVAHPPCGPWGRLSFLCTKQDPECALRAVEQVRAFGGVLEHPTGSKLWRARQLPFAGGLPDAWGGRTYEVRQVAWGHSCEKPTWLYIVGIEPELVLAGIRTEGTSTKRITNGPRGDDGVGRATKGEILHTPIAFAEWLVSLARTATASEL